MYANIRTNTQFFKFLSNPADIYKKSNSHMSLSGRYVLFSTIVKYRFHALESKIFASRLSLNINLTEMC